MPTLEEIRDRVERIVHDVTYHGDVADGFINEAYKRCASLVLLPYLESSSLITVAAGATSTLIPSSWNFDRNIYACFDTINGRSIRTTSSVALLIRQHPDYLLDVAASEMEMCTTQGNQFICWPAPSAEVTLRCAFYKKLTVLSNDDDIPVALPEFLHFRLLAPGACSGIFFEIEEGNDGVMPNTTKHTKAFENAIAELYAFYRTGQSRPEPNRRTMGI